MLALALSLLLAAAPSDEPPANLVHARLSTHAATGGLAATFRGLVRDSGPAWIGYAVPVSGRGHQMCCFRSTEDVDRTAGGCRLENEGAYTIGSGGTQFLEDAPDFIVLFRAEAGRVARIRMLSRGCGIDAGGLPLHWIT